MILLDELQIRRHLIDSDIEKLVRIHLFTSIDSTNRYLKELPVSVFVPASVIVSTSLASSYEQSSKSLTKDAETMADPDLPIQNIIDLCCAEEQTQGRGRFGRDWFSPFAENIYCSSRWSLGSNMSVLSALSLVVSLSVIATLNEFGLTDDIAIKWPNDLLWRGKKLCGILVELALERNGDINAVIGIGLNVNSASQHEMVQSQLDRPWCSLFEITGQYWDRNALVAQLIIKLHEYISKLIAIGFTEFMSLWTNWDYLFGQRITVSQPAGVISGVSQGVNNIGQLILLDEKGVTHYLSSGETSLKI